MSGLRKIVTAWRNEGARSFGVVSDGTPGANGTNGWTPILMPEQDGTRTLLKVGDWVGGSGTKPAVGQYLAVGAYVSTKAAAFNFNSAKRVRFYQAVTNASGVATLNYAAEGFTTVPTIVPLAATTTLLSGPTRSSVTGTPTATSAQITVQQQAILTGIVSALVGATANALVIET